MTIEELNWLDEDELSEALWNCCGSTAWVAGMMELFPVGSATGLYAAASLVWRDCCEEDWLEALGPAAVNRVDNKTLEELLDDQEKITRMKLEKLLS